MSDKETNREKYPHEEESKEPEPYTRSGLKFATDLPDQAAGGFFGIGYKKEEISVKIGRRRK
ncbi:MAG: hypothetical protein MUP55_03385 [Candidatus Aenigmarchaeota archaeon]|nr:hypothetical protein [Candidatus Aenigmarchaeota archaeon]